jgi:hypothetical protein
VIILGLKKNQKIIIFVFLLVIPIAIFSVYIIGRNYNGEIYEEPEPMKSYDLMEFGEWTILRRSFASRFEIITDEVGGITNPLYVTDETVNDYIDAKYMLDNPIVYGRLKFKWYSARTRGGNYYSSASPIQFMNGEDVLFYIYYGWTKIYMGIVKETIGTTHHIGWLPDGHTLEIDVEFDVEDGKLTIILILNNVNNPDFEKQTETYFFDISNHPVDNLRIRTSTKPSGMRWWFGFESFEVKEV